MWPSVCRWMPFCSSAVQFFHQLDAGHFRHIQVGQDQIYTGLFQKGQRIPPVVKGGHHLYTGRFYGKLGVDERNGFLRFADLQQAGNDVQLVQKLMGAGTQRLDDMVCAGKLPVDLVGLFRRGLKDCIRW